MPQLPAAAIVWFQTDNNKNTKQSNQKTNMNKTAFCGVEFMRPVQLNPAALLDTRKAATQFTRTEASCTYGQKKFVAVLRCSRGFYQINSYQVTHLGNNLHRVQNVAGLHFCGTGQTALSKEKKTTTSENKTNKQTNEQNNWKCSYDKWTLQWWSLGEMLCLAHTRKYFWCSGRDKWRDISWSWVNWLKICHIDPSEI